MTKEEKVDWDQLVLDKKVLEIEAVELTESLASPDCVDKEKRERELERVEETIVRIERVVG